MTFVSPRYFETLGIPLIAGRDFDFRDVGRPRVAIVNQAMARRYFPGVNPIGKHVAIGSEQSYEIVGLAGDAKTVELRDPPYPTIYFNMFQESRLQDQFELRTSVDPESMAGTVRRMVRDVLKTVPVKTVTTLAEQVDSNIVPERLIATLSDSSAPGRRARRRRALWAAGVHGGAADQRDRHPDGAWRNGERRKPSGAGRCAGNGVRRPSSWNCDGALEQTTGGKRLPGFENREPGAIGDRRRGHGRGRAAGLISTGPAGGARGPDGGATARVKKGRIRDLSFHHLGQGNNDWRIGNTQRVSGNRLDAVRGPKFAPERVRIDHPHVRDAVFH